MKIVLITKDRPELTKQAIETMKANAHNWDRHKLVVVWDGIWDGTTAGSGFFSTGKQLGVGGAKNFGVKVHEDFEILSFDDIIMFSDNDMYYLPDWDSQLEYVMSHDKPPIQLGGWKHPYHAGKMLKDYRFLYSGRTEDQDKAVSIQEVDAVTGNCFVIRYGDWLKYGPFDANAIGPGQSEDFALSQKIKADNKVVATLDPPVAIHCGLANCEGKPATGWQEMATMAEKQIEANGINKIWLETPDEGTILLERQEERDNSQDNQIVPNGSVARPRFSGLNVGSGQRRFNHDLGWINCDHVSRPPDQVPDVVVDGTLLVEKFGKETQDMVVLHHVIEHFGCGEADEVLNQCFQVLKRGGSLLVFVPHLRRLAGRWLSGELDDFSFFVNVYGAYQGLEGDRHKWGYDATTLYKYLSTIPGTGQIKLFDWREIPGADIAKDWWILGMEVVKG